MRLRTAVIIDGLELCQWQSDALKRCTEYLDIVAFLNCTNAKSGPRRFRHILYYGLNFISMRPTPRRRMPVAVGNAEVFHFQCDRNGAWEKFPPEVAAEISKSNFDVILKFGMGLLRDPDDLGARHGVISFHHGDPNSYRGRPAGFYELLDGASYVGVGVQRINNTLDGGEFLTIRRSKVHHHSYKRTLENAYMGSAQLLEHVVKQVYAGTMQTLPVTPGRLVRLPSNKVVAAFLVRLGTLKLKRLVKGLFFEKNWSVALDSSADLLTALDQRLTELVLTPQRTFPTPAGYTFQADPFFSPDGNSIFVEALSRRTGLGEILKIDANTGDVISRCASGGHHSYPATYSSPSGDWMLAETASWTSPHIVQLGSVENRPSERFPLAGLEGKRLLDPTYFYKEGIHYIFAGERGSAEDTLALFVSDSKLGPYVLHPKSPIVMSPSGARMGGHIFEHNGRVFRVGQDNCFGYGEGAKVFEVTNISPETYQEREMLRVRASGGLLGPHTINLFGGRIVYDYYKTRFSLLAGYRRLLALFARTKDS